MESHCQVEFWVYDSGTGRPQQWHNETWLFWCKELIFIFHKRSEHQTDRAPRYLKDWYTSVSHTHTALMCVDGRKMYDWLIHFVGSAFRFCREVWKTLKTVIYTRLHRLHTDVKKKILQLNQHASKTVSHKLNFMTLMIYDRTVLAVVSLNEVYLIKWTLSSPVSSQMLSWLQVSKRNAAFGKQRRKRVSVNSIRQSNDWNRRWSSCQEKTDKKLFSLKCYIQDFHCKMSAALAESDL